MRSRSTGILLGTVLVAAGIAFPLLVIEVGMRLYHAYVKIQSPYQPHEDPRIVFVRKPNHSKEINALGFRDHERPLEKPENLFRIIVLGDSVTNGYKVKFDDRYTNKLESLLNSQGQRFEVINFGTNQYSTEQEVSIFEAVGRQMEPDLVIVAYALNDPTPDGNMNEFFRRDRAPSVLFYWLREHLYRLYPKLKDEFTRLPGCSSFDYATHMHCDAVKWRKVAESLARLGELSRVDNFRVLLTTFPLLDSGEDASFDNYPWRDIHERVIALAGNHGFETLDLLSAFAGYRPKDIKVSEGDQLHPNALGNQITAQALSKKLISMGVVEQPRRLSSE